MGSRAQPPIDILFIGGGKTTTSQGPEALLGDPTDGCRVTSAPSLQDALAIMGQRNFHAALLDFDADGSCGLDSLALLRIRVPGLPILVLAGDDDEQLSARTLEQGAADYLVAGRDGPDLMCRAIRHAIHRSKAIEPSRPSEKHLRAAFENASVGIGMIDAKGELFSSNPAMRSLFAAATSSPHAGFQDLIAAEDRGRALPRIRDLLVGGGPLALSMDVRFGAKGGEARWMRVNLASIREADGQPPFAVCMIEDISRRKATEDQLRLSAQVLEATTEGVFVTDAGLRIIHVNPAFCKLTGFAAADVLGQPPSVLSSDRHGPDFYAEMWKAIRNDGSWRGEIWNRTKSGELFAAWINISAVRNENGETTHYFAVFSDITDRKRSEERLNHLANHDALTGLPNRALFQERLGRALIRAERNRLVFALLFLDLDQFKQINDNLGHLAGDHLLKEVASRLSGTVRRQDTVARLGGDEFVLIIEDISDFRDAATVARKVLARFAEPFVLSDQPTRVSTSIGISLYPGDGNDVQTLLGQADEAMYCAKKQGRSSFRFAAADLSEKVFERETLQKGLSRAIEENGLEIHYQPIVSLEAGAVQSVEALLRWRHPEVGLMIPGQFLPLAVESGLMPAIGQWVLESSLRQLARWRSGDHPDLRLCLNVGKSELHTGNFPQKLGDCLAANRLPAGAVDIELPAALAMEAAPATCQAISQLHDMGCRVALDDFGAGQTDFRALRKIPIDILKISPDFVRGLPGSGEEAKLIDAAIVAAHSLSISVVAKAVETSEQYDFLRRHRCDAAQGYLFSRPLPPEEFPPPIDIASLAE